MPKLVTLGETMVTFAPNATGPLRYVSDYRLKMAGAESNTAIGVQKFGHSAGWIGRVGDGEFGHLVMNLIRAEGVDTSQVILDHLHQTGIMFKETSIVGVTKVYYYRERSAACFFTPKDLSEDYLKTAEILHLSGITPVLSDSCRETVYAAIEIAHSNGILISFDPNIRKKLWAEYDYTPMIKALTLASDIILIGLDESETLFHTRDLDKIRDICFTQGRTKYLAVKDGANGAYVADKNQLLKIPPYPCTCIDPVGAGDAFNAGFLSGLLEGYDLKKCGDVAAVAGALATQTIGDIEGYLTKEEILGLLEHKETILR